MSVRMNREQLLDWFSDVFVAAEYSGKELLGAYNALTGSADALACTHCGSGDCPGAADTAECPWIGVNRCGRCGSKRGYCTCERAIND